MSQNGKAKNNHTVLLFWLYIANTIFTRANTILSTTWHNNNDDTHWTIEHDSSTLVSIPHTHSLSLLSHSLTALHVLFIVWENSKLLSFIYFLFPPLFTWIAILRTKDFSFGSQQFFFHVIFFFLVALLHFAGESVSERCGFDVNKLKARDCFAPLHLPPKRILRNFNFSMNEKI